MKKITFLASLVMALMLGLSSCGGSKPAAFDNNKALDNPPAIMKALEKPSTRAYGTATQFDLGFATRNATAAARQALAAQLRSFLSSDTELNNYSYQQNASDGNKAAMGKDEEQKNQELVEAIVSEVPVNGAVIIENNIYKTKDNQYQVFVCVEFQGDALKIIDDMTRGYEKYLEQQIGPDKRDEIDRRVQDFREHFGKRKDQMGL